MEASPGRVKSADELERIYRGEYVPGEVTRSTADGRGRTDATLHNSLCLPNCQIVEMDIVEESSSSSDKSVNVWFIALFCRKFPNVTVF